MRIQEMKSAMVNAARCIPASRTNIATRHGDWVNGQIASANCLPDGPGELRKVVLVQPRQIQQNKGETALYFAELGSPVDNEARRV
jgi:hypothetical protein